MRASIGGMITSAPKDGRAQGRKRARAHNNYPHPPKESTSIPRKRRPGT
jgi:hypothetical protein